ncbi:Serine/threonine-protein kinase cot-1 [Phlyctema vagabunda]|uniref:Serine/threonine-protein kinase cot-1 n=1 Tax=Phlyctema vagabunda TaxID=108571 RepID=A0ABR4PBX2_9HELO
MDNNRLYLNLGNTGNNNDRFQGSSAFPTTPSTFPNPISFPGQGQSGQYAQQAPQGQQQSQQPYSTGFAPAGYFNNQAYPPSYPQQPPGQYQQQQQQSQGAQAGYQSRQPPVNPDATNGLVHQFSHQNLGGRASPYGNRQASPAQRPRTAGAPGQPGYGGYLNAPMPSQATQQSHMPDFQGAPERNPDKYGMISQNNQKKCAQMASDFFKDSVKRARDRNVRSVKFQYLSIPPHHSFIIPSSFIVKGCN